MYNRLSLASPRKSCPTYFFECNDGSCVNRSVTCNGVRQHLIIVIREVLRNDIRILDIFNKKVLALA